MKYQDIEREITWEVGGEYNPQTQWSSIMQKWIPMTFGRWHLGDADIRAIMTFGQWWHLAMMTIGRWWHLGDDDIGRTHLMIHGWWWYLGDDDIWAMMTFGRYWHLGDNIWAMMMIFVRWWQLGDDDSWAILAHLSDAFIWCIYLAHSSGALIWRTHLVHSPGALIWCTIFIKFLNAPSRLILNWFWDRCFKWK